MKFSLATIALAATVVASPTSGNPPPSGDTCSVHGNNNGQVACCNSAIPILGSLLCNAAALGTCNAGQSSYCCQNGATGGLINVDLLNCVKLL
ncbi:hypothetical protein MY4824_003852 [Beauveria thailandica]